MRSGICLCDSPLRFEHGYCGRCWNRQFAPVDQPAATPFDGADPVVATAGERTPTSPSPADPLIGYPLDVDPWDSDPFDDYVEAFGNTDGLRIRAIFKKGTGR